MSRFNSLSPVKTIGQIREGWSLRKAVTLIASVSLLTTMAVAVPNAATAAPPTTWSITSSTAGSGSGTVSSQSGLQLIKTSADIFFGPDSGSMVSAISIDGVDLSGADLSSAVGAGSFTVAQGTAPNYNRTVVVTFNLITYTVHFDNQGHGTSPSDATGVITLAFASLPSESTDGDYSFSGWSTDAAGNVMVTADYTPGADSTLYAIWNYNPPFDPCLGDPYCGNPPTVYTVTYLAGGANGTPPAAINVDEGGEFTVATVGDLYKTDYDFAGWSDGSGGPDFNPGDVWSGMGSNFTLTAIWSYNPPVDPCLGDPYCGNPPTDNTVVFDGNGATFGSMYDEVNSNLANLDLNMFARSGYTFAGWNTDSRGGSYGTAYEDGGSFDFSAGGATLYAQWTPNQTYIVTYASGGAVGTPPTQSDISEGASFNLASASGLTMADYYFTGWSDGPSVFNAGDSYTMPASDVVLTATWASDIGSCSSGYTVTYIGNESTGGSTPVDSTCYPLNAEVTLALNTFTRTGFTFDSWNLLTNGQGIGWAETGTFYISQNTVIYAIWHAAAYTVSFDNQGHGSAVGDATNVSTIALASLPSESTDGYYIFLGWSESVGGSVLTGDYTPTQNSTLYAIWSSSNTFQCPDGGSYQVTDGVASNGSSCAGDLIFDSSVISIGNYAFYQAYGITSLVFPSSVTSIGRGSFQGNINLTSVEIPISVTSIYSYAFLGDTALTMHVYVSDAVTSLGTDIFAGTAMSCVNASDTEYALGLSTGAWRTVYEGSINIPSCNPRSITFDANGHGVAPDSLSAIYTVVIAELPVISNSGFFTFLGWSTSDNGSVLSGTYTPEVNVTLYAIWQDNSPVINVFDCSSGGTYRVVNGVLTQPVDGFTTCSGTVTLDSSVTEIGTFAFNGDGNIVSVILPNTVTSIDDEAFKRSSIQSISIPSSVTSIGGLAFYQSYGITIPFLIPDTVSTLGAELFGYNNGLACIYTSESQYALGLIAGAWLDDYGSSFPRCIGQSISFNSNGHEIGVPSSILDVVTISTAELPILSSDGYFSFQGWSTSPLPGSTALTGIFVPVDSPTLYAVWQDNTPPTVTHTVTYASGGGSGTLPTQSDVLENSSFVTASSVGLTKTGYGFAGWSDGYSTYEPGGPYTMSTLNVILTATWAPNIIYFTFDLNNGGREVNLGSVNLGPHYETTVMDFGVYDKGSFDGLGPMQSDVLTGWATNPNGTGIFISEGAVLRPVSTRFTDAGSVTLYAQWAATYTVIFDNQGHGTTYPDATGVSSIAFGSLPSESADGLYTFVGWSTSPSGDVLTGDYSVTGNSTLYAIWSRYFDCPNGGTYQVTGGVASNGRSCAGDLILDSSVTQLGEQAFYRAWYLWSIVIPDSVTSIGYMALAATNIRSLTIPKIGSTRLNSSHSSRSRMPSSA